MNTPYYEIDESKLNADIRLLKTAMQTNWGSNAIAACSVKTNALPWLLRHFMEHGFHAEVVSSEEYDLVMRLGFAPSDVIYNGPIKDRTLFEKVLRDGGRVNLDSSEELTWLAAMQSDAASAADSFQNNNTSLSPDNETHKNIDFSVNPSREGSSPPNNSSPCFHVGLRVNVDFHKLVPDEVPADEEGSRFGYSDENGELARVIAYLKSLPDVRIAGLHLHSSTKSRTVRAYAAVAAFAGEIASRYGLLEEIEYVDMGGGYYGGVAGKPDFADYLPAIGNMLKQYFDPRKVTLIMEPGVSMVSSSFSFVTSVRDVKRIRENHPEHSGSGYRDHVYVVIDGSRLNLNPQVTRRWYPHHFIFKDTKPRDILPSQEIVGATCMEYDRLFETENAPQLEAGDRVVFDLAGGYTICLTPLFIHYFPAIYVRKEDGSVFEARAPWGNDEYLQKYYW